VRGAPLEQTHLGEGGEGEAVVAAGSVVPQSLLMFLGAVPHVGFPAIQRMAEGEAAHELIADLLGDDAGGGDGNTVRVPVHQGLMGVTQLRKRDPIDENLPGVESPHSTEQTANSPAHGHGGRDADVEAVDLADRGGGDGNTKGALANAGDEALALRRTQELGVAEPGDALDVGRKDDGSSDDRPGERPATDFIDADEEVTDGPAGFFLAKRWSGRRGAGHG